MFIVTPEFKFLDVINYLGPGHHMTSGSKPKCDVTPAILLRNSDAQPCLRTKLQRATVKLHSATLSHKQRYKYSLYSDSDYDITMFAKGIPPEKRQSDITIHSYINITSLRNYYMVPMQLS